MCCIILCDRYKPKHAQYANTRLHEAHEGNSAVYISDSLRLISNFLVLKFILIIQAYDVC